MRLSDLRPCDHCKGPINPVFATITIIRHLIDPEPANQVLGLTQYFGGNLTVAQALVPTGEVTEPLDKTEVVLCQQCLIDHLGEVLDQAWRNEEGTE